MGKTRDFFKEIGDIKDAFQERMGIIKDWNDKDLTEAEEIRKNWQELHKNILMTQITMMMWSLAKSPTSWSEVSWALRSITMNKATGGDGISSEIFQILKEYC